jgi:hypothetical protein
VVQLQMKAEQLRCKHLERTLQLEESQVSRLHALVEAYPPATFGECTQMHVFPVSSRDSCRIVQWYLIVL